MTDEAALLATTKTDLVERFVPGPACLSFGEAYGATVDEILSVKRRFVARTDAVGLLDAWWASVIRHLWPKRNFLTEAAIVHLYERGYLEPCES